MKYNVCDIEFEVFDSINGVVVSGGADSALLLYFLLKYATNPLHIFTLSSQYKGTTNSKQAVDVVSNCAKLTGNYNFEHHINYIPGVQDLEKLFYFPKKIISEGYIYTGITANPPKSVTDTFTTPPTETYARDPTVVRPIIAKNYYRPWTNIDKKKIAEIYREYNLIESLFPLTRSCEYVPSTINKIPDLGTDHCGQCWGCQERKWGFGMV